MNNTTETETKTSYKFGMRVTENLNVPAYIDQLQFSLSDKDVQIKYFVTPLKSGGWFSPKWEQILVHIDGTPTFIRACVVQMESDINRAIRRGGGDQFVNFSRTYDSRN